MDVREVRSKYFDAIGSQRKVESLLRQIKSEDINSSSLLGYKAACEAMVAQYSWNPYTKLAQVNKAFNLFDQAIRQDKDNVEVRFLRFSVQHNLPDFLRKERIFAEDKRLLIEHIEKLNYSDDFYEFVKTYLKDSKRFDNQQLSQLETA